MTEASEWSAILIRSVFKDDVPALAELAGQLGYVSDTEEIGRRLDQIENREDHQVFVAEAACVGVIGWVHVLKRNLLVLDPCAELGGLVVKDGWRGQGVGKLLLERAEGWARAQDLAQMRVSSNTARQGVPGFYENQGYHLSKTQNVFFKSLE